MPQPIKNGESGESVRAKLNDAFLELAGKADVSAINVQAITGSIAALLAELSALKAAVHTLEEAGVGGGGAAIDDNASPDSTGVTYSAGKIKALLDTAISGLTGSADASLNTIAKLAQALDNDPQFAASITVGLAQKADAAATAAALAGKANTADLAAKADAATVNAALAQKADAAAVSTALAQKADAASLSFIAAEVAALRALLEGGSGTPATAPAAFISGDWTLASGDGQATLTITTLPNNGGSAITALQYRLNVGSPVAISGTGVGSRTISSLTNGTAYSVQVRAVNAVGSGAWSDTKSVTPAAQQGNQNVLMLDGYPVLIDGYPIVFS